MTEKYSMFADEAFSRDRQGWFMGDEPPLPLESDDDIDPEEPSYTSGQAARLLGIPPRTMRHYLSTGRVGGVQNPITGTWHISQKVLFEFASARGQELSPLAPPATIVLVEKSSQQTGDWARAIEACAPGSRAIQVNDVFDGLVQAAALVPTVLVVDAEMPELGGDELLRILRRNPRTAGIRVIAYVGRPELTARMRSAGADEVVNCTAGQEEICQTLMRLLPSRSVKGDPASFSRTLFSK